MIRCSPGGGDTFDKIKGWIPAYAESTPRIEKKYSGGNDGGGGGIATRKVPFCRPRGCGDPCNDAKMDSRLRGNDGGWRE